MPDPKFPPLPDWLPVTPVTFTSFQVIHQPSGDGDCFNTYVYGLDAHGQLWKSYNGKWQQIEMPETAAVSK